MSVLFSKVKQVKIMKYTVTNQPNIPHNDKKIIKSTQVTHKAYLTINDLLSEYVSLEQMVKMYRDDANKIVDELIAINKVHCVDDIPTKL